MYLVTLAARRFVRFWAFGRAKFPKTGDSLPRTPMNRRAKFDAASLILGGEIRNRTNTNSPGNFMSKYADDTYLIIPATNVKSCPAEIANIETWAW